MNWCVYITILINRLYDYGCMGIDIGTQNKKHLWCPRSASPLDVGDRQNEDTAVS